MKYIEAQARIEEAGRDIESAENQIGNARPEEMGALFAAIAQAKLLAVIASQLTEMKETQLSTAELNYRR